jgi:hypothetical protein
LKIASTEPGKCDPNGGAANDLALHRGQRVRICRAILDALKKLFLSRKVDNISVAPIPESLTIRIERNDIEVLYAPRPSANPSANPMPTSRRQGGEQ